MQTNKDLLLCENKYYLEKSKLENILDFNKEQDQIKPKQLKTEKISSNGTLRCTLYPLSLTFFIYC